MTCYPIGIFSKYNVRRLICAIAALQLTRLPLVRDIASLLWRIVGGGQGLSPAFHPRALCCVNLEMVHRENLT
jgi:hypothetical protein